jgi:hypothetical protein
LIERYIPVWSRVVEAAGVSKSRELGLPVGHLHDVGRRQVLVHHARKMNLKECGGHLMEETERRG